MIQLRSVRSSREGYRALDGLDVHCAAGRRIGIMGATGSGKTSLLRVIAGLQGIQEGEVRFHGQRVKGPDERLIPGEPGIAYLSQHAELKNQYRVSELLRYHPDVTGEMADQYARLCRIQDLTHRWSDELSGGERQRVALTLALLDRPRLLLLDEPFSQSDPLHRSVLKEVLREMSHESQVDMMMASHDTNDLFPWADEIWVLQQGRLVAQGTPESLYHDPPSDYVASLAGEYITLRQDEPLSRLLVSRWPKDRREIRVRPGHFRVGQGIAGVVREVEFQGNGYRLELEIMDHVRIPVYHYGDTPSVGEMMDVMLRHPICT